MTATARDFQATVDAWTAGRISTSDFATAAASSPQSQAAADRAQEAAFADHAAAVARLEQGKAECAAALAQVPGLVGQLASAIASRTSGLDPATRSRLAAAVPDLRSYWPRMETALTDYPVELPQVIADSRPVDRAPRDVVALLQERVPTVAHRDLLARTFQLAEEAGSRGVDLTAEIAALRSVLQPLRDVLG